MRVHAMRIWMVVTAMAAVAFAGTTAAAAQSAPRTPISVPSTESNTSTVPSGTPTPVTTMTLDVTAEVAGGKPAPDGSLITAYALYAMSYSDVVLTAPCSEAAVVRGGQATLVVDGACAMQYAAATGGVGTIAFEIEFTNDYGQGVGAGSMDRITFTAGRTIQPVTVHFDIDPSVEAIGTGETPPPTAAVSETPSTLSTVTPVAPSTGTGVETGGGPGVAWVIFGAGLAMLVASAGALHLPHRHR